MRIVVTGGSGIVGGFVVRNLIAAGHEVINVTRRPPRDAVPGAGFVQVDTTDMGQVIGALKWRGTVADAVIHLAALPNVWPVASSLPTEVWRINALSVYNVAEACAQLGIAKFVETSSVNVHQYMRSGGTIAPPRWPMDATTPNWVVNAYGLSKIAGEATAQMLHARTGAQAISIRPALVIALDEYPMRIGQMRGDRPATWLSWSYSDAEDLAEAYRLSVEKENLGCEALYIVNDDAFTDEPIETSIQ
ncbi:MAG: NAD(P)-dependent oxidoreductase, partial [Thermomicrobia bacterium]|nr:NAD(P)-dependent oxidoreductase [Thermomicrobia bacterium]